MLGRAVRLVAVCSVLLAGCESGDDDGAAAPCENRLVEHNIGDKGGEAGTAVRATFRTASGQTSRLDLPDGTKMLDTLDPADRDDRLPMFLVRGPDGSARIRLTTLVDCKAVLVTNVDGAPYEFEIGFDGRLGTGEGSGMGCVDADGDGTRDLVAISYTYSGDHYSWRRTIVQIDAAGRATNGAVDEGTFEHPQDAEAIASLNKATCGERTYALPLD